MAIRSFTFWVGLQRSFQLILQSALGNPKNKMFI